MNLHAVESRLPDRLGPSLGVVGGVAGLAASLFVLVGPVASTASQTTGGATTTGTVSGIDVLLGHPDAQVALLVWPLVLGTVAVVGLVAARRGERRWLWAAALTLGAFVVLGAASLGLLYAPAALLLLVAAALSREE